MENINSVGNDAASVNAEQQTSGENTKAIKIGRGDYLAAEIRIMNRTLGNAAINAAKKAEKVYKEGEIYLKGKSLSEWQKECSLEELNEMIDQLTDEEKATIVFPSNVFNEYSGMTLEEAKQQEESLEGYKTVLSTAEKEAQKAMAELIFRNTVDACAEYKKIEQEKIKQKFNLKNEKKNALKKNPRAISTAEMSNSVAAIEAKLQDLDEEEEALEYKSPEHYIVVKGLKLREYQKQAKEDGVTITPYVQKNMDIIEENMFSCTPTFIHGHLGSGKTQIAIMAAKEAAISRKAFLNTNAEILRKRINGEIKTQEEALDSALEEYVKQVKGIKKEIKQKGEGVISSFRPLLISGSKEITAQDLFIEKTLKLSQVNNKSIQEQNKEIEAEIQKWVEEHKNPSSAEKESPEKEKAEKRILDLYLANNSAYGTEVKKIENQLFQGIKYGRPVIIDEVNAIPAAVLIGLNRLLTAKPGEMIDIPGEEQPVKVHDGFSITMTGNLNSQAKDSYYGVEELNAAFKSRLHVMEHDYLPMSSSGGYETQFQGEGDRNELFHAVMSYLVDDKGNLTLPDIMCNIGKIYDLCALAHDTQLIFAGKWNINDKKLKSSSQSDLNPNLKSSVLSIRNILDVMNSWNKGAKKDLDTALWDGFISHVDDDNERNVILALAKELHGFYDPIDGWEVNIVETGSKAPSDIKEIHPEKFHYRMSDLETFDLRHTVEAIFGHAKERERYPEDKIIEEAIDEYEDDVEEPFTEEEYVEKLQELEKIKKTIRALEILGEKFGCNKVEAN